MSDETKWTKGQYRCRVDECVKVRDEQDGLLATLSHLKLFGKRRDPDEVAATGRLLAAAPRLYEALAAFVDNSSVQVNHPDECERAEAALAKARGETTEQGD